MAPAQKPRSPEAVALGAAIRAKREAKKLSVQALASKAKIDRSCIHRIEHGSYEPPLDTLRRIAEGLGTSVTRILECAREVA